MGGEKREERPPKAKEIPAPSLSKKPSLGEYRRYKRKVEIFQDSSTEPKWRQALTILAELDGDAWEQVESLAMADVKTDDGISHILARLDRWMGLERAVELKRVMEEFHYAEYRT